jgi:hypothetical protein
VTINVSHRGLFSTMTLSGGGQSGTVTPPGSNATFTFATPIAVPPGGSVTFSLSAVIAANPVMLGGEIKYAGLAAAPLPMSTSTWPLSVALSILGITLLGLPDSTRRRAITITVLTLGLAAASTGCGSSSSGPRVLVGSAQQVTSVVISAAGVPATVAGLPAKLGTITVL